jgi:hypothetical protein
MFYEVLGNEQVSADLSPENSARLR